MERQSCLASKWLDMQHLRQHRKQESEKLELPPFRRNKKLLPEKLSEQSPSAVATHQHACKRLRKHELVIEKVYNLMRPCPENKFADLTVPFYMITGCEPPRQTMRQALPWEMFLHIVTMLSGKRLRITSPRISLQIRRPPGVALW